MPAPVSANTSSPKAAVLVDPFSGLPYKAGSTPASSTFPIANINSPVAAVVIDASTGLPEVITPDNAYALAVDPATLGAVIPLNFIGLSFETSAAVQPNPPGALSVNTNLKNIMSVLGSNGSIQFGNFTVDTTTPIDSRVQAAANFCLSFGSGWQSIWSVSWSHNDPTGAAHAATLFSAILPNTIYAIGSEPNFYGTNFSTYSAQWDTIHDAILAAVPGATFEAPDTGVTYNVPLDSYTPAFAGSVYVSEISFLTVHSITTGPTFGSFNDTITHYWADAVLLDQIQNLPSNANVVSSGLKIRSTSVTGITGVAGTTDTLASALYNLWSLVLRIQTAGWIGADFLASDANTDAAPYSPFIRQSDGTYLAKANLYVMVMFNYLSGGTVVGSTSALPTTTPFDMPYLSVKCTDGKTRVLVLNKSLTDWRGVRITSTGTLNSADVMLLTGATPDATTVTLGGATIQSNGSFSPNTYHVDKTSGIIAVNIPACSAVLIALN